MSKPSNDRSHNWFGRNIDTGEHLNWREQSWRKLFDEAIEQRDAARQQVADLTVERQRLLRDALEWKSRAEIAEHERGEYRSMWIRATSSETTT